MWLLIQSCNMFCVLCRCKLTGVFLTMYCIVVLCYRTAVFILSKLKDLNYLSDSLIRVTLPSCYQLHSVQPARGLSLQRKRSKKFAPVKVGTGEGMKIVAAFLHSCLCTLHLVTECGTSITAHNFQNLYCTASLQGELCKIVFNFTQF